MVYSYKSRLDMNGLFLQKGIQQYDKYAHLCPRETNLLALLEMSDVMALRGLHFCTYLKCPWEMALQALCVQQSRQLDKILSNDIEGALFLNEICTKISPCWTAAAVNG